MLCLITIVIWIAIIVGDGMLAKASAKEEDKK